MDATILYVRLGDFCGEKQVIFYSVGLAQTTVRKALPPQKQIPVTHPDEDPILQEEICKIRTEQRDYDQALYKLRYLGETAFLKLKQ